MIDTIFVETGIGIKISRLDLHEGPYVREVLGKNKAATQTRVIMRQGLRDQVFACGTGPSELAFRPMLFRLAGLPIKHHTKVRSGANPFDPAWTAYF